MTISLTENINQFRSDTFGAHDLFRNRWSPRAMTGQPIDQDVLMGLFEAAHWAPSSGNNQPWRFLYAHRDTPAWQTYFDLLAPGNQRWCVNAAVLLVVVSRTTRDDGKPARTHAYDTGAAWGMLALEGSLRGMVVHGMAGFDYDQAAASLGVPDGFVVQAMAAIGILADKTVLPPDQQEREKPSGRKDLNKLIAEGSFDNRLL
jgi:nitroreductase